MTAAINHLAGTTGNTDELLSALTPEQLAEQVEFWLGQRAKAQHEGRNYDAYRYGNCLRTADKVSGRKSHA